MGFIKTKIKSFFAYKSDREVQNKELLDFAIGVAGQNQAYNIVSSWLMYFCTDLIGIDALLIGTVLGVMRIWDAFNDPIVGTIVDRHVFKNGEKLRPFLKIMALPVGILTAMMFVDYGFLPEPWTGVYLIVVYFLWDFLYSFQDLSMWGMTSMISTHSSERARAAQFGRIGAMVGGWIPGLIPLMIENLPKFGISEMTIFTVLGIAMGIGGMSLSMFTAKTKERAPVYKPEGKFSDSIKLIFQNKIAMALVIAAILSNFTLSLQDVYFFKYMVSVNIFGLTVEGLNVKFIYGLVVGLPGSAAMFVATWIAKKLGGMKRTLIIATILNIVIRVISYFIGYEGWRIFIVMIVMGIGGIPNGLNGIATTTIWGDSIDYMEWKTGHRNEGSVFALQNLVAKIGTGISTFTTGLALKIMDYDPDVADAIVDYVPSETFFKLAWPLFILTPALGQLFYLIPLLTIKYTEKQKKEIERELKIRREAAKIDERVKSEANILDIDIY